MKRFVLPLILILFLTFTFSGFVIDYTSQYPTHDDDHVKATTKYSTSYWSYFATDPAKSLTGDSGGVAWVSVSGTNTNQRFHIDLGSGKVIKRIYYENYHATGSFTNAGVNNFTFWGSNTEASFLELTYGTDTGWTQITPAQSTFDEHTGANEADPKYITVTNSTAYQYYAFKFADNHTNSGYMGVRRIELQIEDVEEEENAVWFGINL